MNDFHQKLLINADARTVYQALTTQRGLRGWWTTTCHAGEAVGSTIEVHFGTTRKLLRIATLTPDREVRWECTEAHLDVPGVITNPSEWKGTTITFRLTPVSDSATTLTMTHTGLVPSFQCYDICTAGWRQYLSSLKNFAEKGNGAPYTPSQHEAASRSADVVPHSGHTASAPRS